MEFSVHLRCSAVVAIVDCPDQGQFIGFLSLKQAALQSIWVFQESLITVGEALRAALTELLAAHKPSPYLRLQGYYRADSSGFPEPP